MPTPPAQTGSGAALPPSQQPGATYLPRALPRRRRDRRRRHGERAPRAHGRARAASRSGSRSSASTRTSSRTISSSTCSSTRRASRRGIIHPNVAQVFDLGKDDDTYWIAMEYLHGEPLREVMRRTEELGSADAAGDRVPHHRRRRRGPPRRARAARQERRAARPRPPRRHAAQPVRHVRRLHQGRRLRHRQVQLAHVVARARARSRASSRTCRPEQVRGARIDRTHRHLRARRRALGAHDRPAPLPHGERSRHAREGAGVQRPAPVDDRARLPDRAREDRDEGAREEQAASASRRRASSRARSSRCSCGAGSSSRATRLQRTSQSIFADRIQKREAHLRWAAEVTQTGESELKAPHSELRRLGAVVRLGRAARAYARRRRARREDAIGRSARCTPPRPDFKSTMPLAEEPRGAATPCGRRSTATFCGHGAARREAPATRTRTASAARGSRARRSRISTRWRTTVRPSWRRLRRRGVRRGSRLDDRRGEARAAGSGCPCRLSMKAPVVRPAAGAPAPLPPVDDEDATRAQPLPPMNAAVAVPPRPAPAAWARSAARTARRRRRAAHAGTAHAAVLAGAFAPTYSPGRSEPRATARICVRRRTAPRCSSRR